MDNRRKFWLLVAAIVGVIQLETVALFMGINGMMLKTAFVAIGLFAGVSLPFITTGKKGS